MSTIEEIKNRLDIVELISSYLRLQKAGRNYKALCPFHSEKTPSFMVSPERQLWRCFGCGKGGSIFDFIMEMEGVEFSDALRILAQRAGVELKKIDPQLKTERSRLYEICHLANQFFIRQLQASQAGQQLQEYLNNRGLKTETIQEWQIGYAPSQRQALLNFLINRGYPKDEILKAGLIIKSEQNEYYDRFRDRIIFPIRDINGVVVGFTGRENPFAPNSRMGKYINIPNTLIYDKGRILYGLDKAKLAIKKENLCILVEGQTDVIMAHQTGFANVVASSGTALTENQLKMIKRYTENLATAFDMDKAGETATKRGLDLAVALGFNAKVISLPNNQDPADCLSQDTSLWTKAVKAAQGLVEFYFTNAFAQYHSHTAEGKKQISRLILPILKKIPNKVEQAHWLSELAVRLRVQEAALAAEMEKVKESADPITKTPPAEQSLSKNYSTPTDLEKYALGIILAHPQSLHQCKDEPCYLFSDGQLKQIFKTLKREKDNQLDLERVKKKLPIHLANLVDILVFQAETQKYLVDEFNPEKEIRFCFGQLKNKHLKNKLNQLNLAIKEAENRKDISTLKKLTKQFQKLASHFSP